MLATELGLTGKVVSERHYYASLHKFTAGEAAKELSKAVGKKISAAEVKELYSEAFSKEMEWHHSGFYKGKHGDTMGRTFFLSKNELDTIIMNYKSLNPKRVVYAFYWTWHDDSGKWCKQLKAFSGKRTDLPSHSTECDEFTYKVVLKKEGQLYKGWEEPKTDEFQEEADKLRIKKYKNIFKYEHWTKVTWSRSKAFMGHSKKDFLIAKEKHYQRQCMQQDVEHKQKERETARFKLLELTKLPCVPVGNQYNFFRVVSTNSGIIIRENGKSFYMDDKRVVMYAKRRIRKYLSILENYLSYKDFYAQNSNSEFAHFDSFEDYLKLLEQ